MKNNEKMLYTTPRHTITVPGDHVMRACREVYSPEDADLVKWTFYRAMRMTWAEAAEFYGVGSDILSRVWRGKPMEGELSKAVAAFRLVKDAAGKNARPHYAMTSMARKMARALDVALELSNDGKGGFVFIGADPGFGKTTVCTTFTAENNHGRTCYLPNKRIGGVKFLVQSLAEANNVNTYISYNDMIGRVETCFDKTRIIIADDAHKLIEGGDRNFPKLEYLMGLMDATKCVIVLPAALDRFGGAMNYSPYNAKQFWRRTKYRTIICGWEPEMAPDGELLRTADQVRRDDVALLWKWRYPRMEMSADLATVLDSIALHESGGFGEVANALDDAEHFAAKQRKQFSPKIAQVVADQHLHDLESLAKAFSRNSSIGRGRF